MKLDIYNSENIRSLSGDMYNPPSIMILCHTSLGDLNDKDGRFYEAGKEYRLQPEVVEPKKNTDYKECILCWISMSEGFGGRFAIVGNIYVDGEVCKPNWPNFLDYFVCPIARERTNKLEEIGI